jgi:RNA polymerase sigma-70 factor, ECF subfamily
MPTQEDPLAHLLAGCSRGDRQAFEELYRQSSAKLYGVCLAMLRREDLAEDVLQDAFVKIWRRSASYDPNKGNAMTWMTSIARNRALDLLRSAHVQVSQVMDEYRDEDFASDKHNPAFATEFDASTRAVIECLGRLKEQQRHCIMMAYYYGHTHDELSALLQTPLGTVKAWIRRGLEKLRECLG